MQVLLATDSPDLGHALSLFLSEQSIRVLDVVEDADDLLKRAEEGRPDAVVLDWRLGEAAATRVVAELMTADDPTPVIVLCSTQERGRAGACGAAALTTLGDHPEELLAALREVGPGA